jgi:hypothetical protein
MYNHRPYVKAEYLSINNFIKDGFEKVCDVIELTNGKWYYENIVLHIPQAIARSV